MAVLAKPFALTAGLVGSCCAVAIPSSLSSNGAPEVNTQSLGGGTNFYQVSQESSLASAREGGGEDNGRHTLTFEDLFQTINSEYKSKQALSGQDQKDLGGKDRFGDIVGESSSNLKWSILKNSGKDCERDQKGKSTYCGYLELQNNHASYKIKIEHYKEPGSKDLWNVTVVKKGSSENSIEYGNAYSPSYDRALGLQENNVSFESLSSFEESNDNDEGRKLSGLSIKQEE